MFECHERFRQDSEFLIDLKLCQVRLMKDGELDWFMLVPRVKGVTEIIELSKEQQVTLMKEIDLCSRLLKEEHPESKINIGSLGNVVSDLHVHIIARYEGDRAWPGTIWGTKANAPFKSERTQFWKEYFDQ